MLNKGIYLSNGATYNPDGVQLNSIRMGFASMNLVEIERCVKLLKSLVG